MQVDSASRLRNVAVVGHNDTGKTSLISGLLFTGGAATRLAKVEDGNTVTDFDAEEIKRGLSIGLGTCFVPWNKHKVNLIDCPGMGIFFAETRGGMRAADASLLCIHGVAGIQVNSEKVWEHAESLGQPVAIHLTMMDRENADFERLVAELQDQLDRSVTPVHYPIGKEASFSGVVDLVSLKAIQFDQDGDGKGKVSDLPDDVRDEANEYRGKLVEAVAESDEELMEIYFDAGDLDEEQLRKGLRSAVASRSLFPLTLSSGLHGIGNSALLDSIVDTLPEPGALPATNGEGEEIELGDGTSVLVFKTLNDPFSGKISIFRVTSGELSSDSTLYNPTSEEDERLGNIMHLQGKQGDNVPKMLAGDIGGVAKLKETHTGDTLCAKGTDVRIGWVRRANPAISFAVEPKSQGDEEKIGEALSKLVEEDPSLKAARDPQTGEFLVSGADQLHVEIAVAKLKDRFKVEVLLHQPKVPYRETLRKPADGHGRHKKQSGGRGQFADCKIKMEPVSDGEFEFIDEIFGGSIPQNYRPAVEKGLLEAAERGYLAGYPVVNFRVRLLDGQYHDVDSSEMAFKVAGSLAFKDAMAKASPTLLEPVMHVEVTTTEEFMGDIMGDLSQRRGRPQGMEAKGTNQVVTATVPMAEMLNYAPALRSMTQGRASFSMEFSHYEEVPKQVQDKIIAEAKQTAEAS